MKTFRQIISAIPLCPGRLDTVCKWSTFVTQDLLSMAWQFPPQRQHEIQSITLVTYWKLEYSFVVVILTLLSFSMLHCCSFFFFGLVLFLHCSRRICLHCKIMWSILCISKLASLKKRVSAKSMLQTCIMTCFQTWERPSKTTVFYCWPMFSFTGEIGGLNALLKSLSELLSDTVSDSV